MQALLSLQPELQPFTKTAIQWTQTGRLATIQPATPTWTALNGRWARDHSGVYPGLVTVQSEAATCQNTLKALCRPPRLSTRTPRVSRPTSRSRPPVLPKERTTRLATLDLSLPSTLTCQLSSKLNAQAPEPLSKRTTSQRITTENWLATLVIKPQAQSMTEATFDRCAWAQKAKPFTECSS